MTGTRTKMQIEDAVKQLKQAHPELTSPQFEQARKEIERVFITADEKKKIKKFLENNPQKANTLFVAWLKEEQEAGNDPESAEKS